MFTYEDMTTQTALGGRWYDTPSGAYPSITTILGGTEPPEKTASLERWRESMGREEAAAFTQRAADHGTNVHLLAERYLKGEQVDAPIDGGPVPDADMKSFNSIRLKLDKVDEVWGQEVPLFSSELEVAGRCDLVGVYRGVASIVDFKTSTRVKGDAAIHDYRLQLLFYAIAHNEMFGTDIQQGVVIMASDVGFPQEFKVRFTDELHAELRERVKQYWTTVLAKA